MSTGFEFEILIDESFLALTPECSLKPVDNKNVLTILNDFEDEKWRYYKFQNFIWDNIAETALSQKERESLSNQSHSLLTAAASNLRLTDSLNEIGKGSELAEIVLYGIMKNHYKALPVVPKIFYKQNVQDNAKGADSVHIVLEGPDSFTIWFGEAKFYSSIEDSRLTSVIESVKNSLSTTKLKKENAIVTNLQDIDSLIEDVELKEKIKDALSPKESIDNLKPILHIPILLLHQCDHTCKAKYISDDYREKIISWHKDRSMSFFTKQVKQLSEIIRYSEITFHLILFPVPEKQTIVDKFISAVQFYKGQ
ncbi:uncharacterized protein DUF1837 [Desulfobotulus alkaliphilus]|uniref:Uncharacterized protein DUF1837 n=1 Tax=Desulfobotulus alkaliphilus TaxID=622671 RepID=A0A562RXD9_9BACT|nr:DUF1837 domain-containing protein [Desulfobotulus alkaliphilus]TWI72980.1 uncharacterized protein DUF1837 [Desulfobotulus alkaliphilus]